MEPQLQNWDNFCKYHATGDWHSTWTQHSSQGEILDENYLTLHFFEGISVSCTQKVEEGKEFFMAVDWLANSDLNSDSLYRGIRHYIPSGLKSLTLELFSIAS